MAKKKTPQQVAREQAKAALAPYLAELEREAAASAQRAAARGQQIQGFSQAAAAQLAPIGGQVNQAYSQAAQREDVMARGFSAGYQQAVGGSASEANALLAQQGSPQQVNNTAAAGADVLYGLGGVIPASSLGREGAAFGAAASMLPATELGMGRDRLTRALAEGEEEQQKFAGMRREAALKLPDIEREILDAIYQRGQQQQSIDIQRQYLLNQQRATGADITGFDPVTGMPTADVVTAAAGQGAKAKAARAKAVAKRNEATVDALADAEGWVESQVKTGSRKEQIGSQPVVAYRQKRGKQTITYYAKQGGGYTTNPAEAVQKPVYQTVPIPKPQYDKLRRQLISQLTRQLGRFGYRANEIAAYADDVLRDYFSLAERHAANRPKPRPKRERRGGR